MRTGSLLLLLLVGCSKSSRGPIGDSSPPTPGTTPPRTSGTLPPGLRGLPEGLLAYTEEATCPAGWSEWSPGVGRTLVAVEDGGDVGTLAGDPLIDAAPRGHDHGLSATFDIPGAGISGISGCCNGSPGASGSYPASGFVDAVDSGIPTLALRICRLDSGSDDDLGHSLPAGVAAWYDRGSCPDGMVRVANSTGHLVLPTDDPTAVGQTMGVPLAPGEVRTHTHEASLIVDIPVASLAAAGGGNNDTARSGVVETKTTTEPADSGLPTAGALLCEVIQEVPTEGGADEELPSGAIVWSTGDCPVGLVEHSPLIGRVPVGAPAGTAPGTPHGDPLPPLTAPQHEHTGSLELVVPENSVALVSGCCNDSNGGKGTFGVTVVSEPATEPLPAIHLRACVRP